MIIEKYSLYDEALERLVGCIKNCSDRLVADNQPLTMAFSGGGTPRQYLPQLADSDMTWADWRITLVDERWVPPTDNMSNEKLVREEFINHLDRSSCPLFIPMWQNNLDSAGGAMDFACRWGKLAPSVLLLGMGNDGHIASLFPCRANAGPDDGLCVAVSKSPTGHERLSLSSSTITSATFVILILAGSEKLSLAKKFIDLNDSDAYPVCLLKQREPDTTLVLNWS